jgi:hypothetical protein
MCISTNFELQSSHIWTYLIWELWFYVTEMRKNKAKCDICRADINDHDCWSWHMSFLLLVFWSDRIAISKVRNASKLIVNIYRVHTPFLWENSMIFLVFPGPTLSKLSTSISEILSNHLIYHVLTFVYEYIRNYPS